MPEINRATVRRCVALVTMAVLAGCSESDLDSNPAAAPGPDRIVFRRLNLQPEGIEYDARHGRFVAGSRTEGVIHTVDDAGNVAVLVADPGLTSTLGLHIADDRLAAAGTLASGGIGLGLYDRDSGAVLDVVDLTAVAGAGGHLANDVTIDADGNAYVTDTLAGVIYRVTRDGVASRFAEDERFGLLNGIDYHPDGYLIVAAIGGPRLFRIPVDAPAAVTEVATPFSIGGDGIVFRPDGVLAVVSNALAADGTLLGSGVTLLASTDGWQSAAVVGAWVADGNPTTGAVRGDDVHVIYAHLFETTREEYEIVRVQAD